MILCYNVAFLLSGRADRHGHGAADAVADGSLAAGLLAGTVAAFNEYRLVWEVGHLQTLSVYWFPFVLLGAHRYLTTGRRWPLAGAVLAWVALNLSSVDHLAYGSPFIAAFTLVEAVRLGRWRDWRIWRDLMVGVFAVFAISAPFLWPYVQMQQRFNFAADAAGSHRPFGARGRLSVALPRLVVPIALAIVALVASIGGPWLPSRRTAPSRGVAPRLVLALFALTVARGVAVARTGGSRGGRGSTCRRSIRLRPTSRLQRPASAGALRVGVSGVSRRARRIGVRLLGGRSPRLVAARRYCGSRVSLAGARATGAARSASAIGRTRASPGLSRAVTTSAGHLSA